jgi:peptidoglycan/LPS O-acetylase OafA/YrhL
VRIRSLDGLRGFAAVIVLIHHALLAVPVLAEPYVTGDRADEPIAGLLLYTPLHFFWEGRAAVYVFFILSGIVLTLPVMKAGAAFSWLAYYPQRLLRLYIPVWGAVILGVLWLIAVPRSLWLQNRAWDLDARSVFLDMTLLAGHGGIVSPLWSLRWEIWFSLLLPVFVFVGIKLARVWWLVVIGCLGIIAVSGVLNQGALTYLPMFMIGVSVATVLPKVVESGRKLGNVTGCVLTSAAVVALVSPWFVQFAFGAGVGAAPLTALATVGALLAVYVAMTFAPIRRFLETRALQWLGLISFSLYLVHEPVIISSAYFFGDNLLIFGILLGVAVSFALAFLFYRFVEIPAHKLARRAGDRIRARTGKLTQPHADLAPPQ